MIQSVFYLGMLLNAIVHTKAIRQIVMLKFEGLDQTMRYRMVNVNPWQCYKFTLVVSLCLIVHISLKCWFVEQSILIKTNDVYAFKLNTPLKIEAKQQLKRRFAERSISIKNNQLSFFKFHTPSLKLPVEQPIQSFKTLVPTPVQTLFDVGRTVNYVNCRQVFDGNVTAIKEAVQTFPRIRKYKYPEYYIRMATNCTNFILNRNYIIDFLTTEEESFPLAFSILMYRDIEQFERLLRAIYRPQNSYCVHVDLKSDKRVYAAVKTITDCLPNVYLPTTRISVVWGQISVLEANLICMRELCKRNKLWKYMINLTGQEFPLKTNYEMVKILTAFQGANDVGLARRPVVGRWKGLDDPPHGIKPVKGSLLIAACRGFVEYAIYDQRAKDFLKWLENTTVPDETLFASLNSNPHLEVPGSSKEFVDRVSPRDIFVAHFVNWEAATCKGKMLREVCILGVGSLPELAKTETLFANKFYWNYQRAAYEFLHRENIDTSFYEKLEYVVNRKDKQDTKSNDR